MKARHWIGIALILALCLASCAKKQTATGGKTYSVGVTLLTKSHPFYQELEAAMKDVAARANVKLNVQSAEFDMKDQQAQIETFITQRVDALVVCPVDSDTIAGAIKEANKAGIPVFTADIAANGGMSSATSLRTTSRGAASRANTWRSS